MKKAEDILVLSGATAIIAAAVFFFLVPSHAAVSSVSGLAIVLHHFVPMQVSAITMILNLVLLIVGFLTCGHEFGFRTVYTSLLMPAFLALLERLFPGFQSLTGDQVLDVICYVFTVSIGLSILFNRNASSGGIDIIAKVLNKYLRMDLGKAMSAAGIAIAFSSAFAYDAKTVIISLLGTYLNGIVLDHFIFDQNLKRRVCIVSPKEQEIRNYILNELHSGSTIYEAIGAYHLQKHDEIITVVDKAEFQKLMNYLDRTDPEAFVTVYKVSDMHYRSKHLKERAFPEKTSGREEED
ncbi:MAG: YitT family protein [Anaerolactibacter massiliensis]|nr:YitT family protein [Anaerolactibacter massiliensis]